MAKGSYGTSMNGIEKRQKKHPCRNCIYGKKLGESHSVFCNIRKQTKRAGELRYCKYFVKRYSSQGGACKTYTVSKEEMERIWNDTDTE